jgi:hypothetical protein
MRGDVLWPLLFGSALTLVTTLAAQWFSLDFQTKRQREARRSDVQRSALLQVRDLLVELSTAEQRLAAPGTRPGSAPASGSSGRTTLTSRRSAARCNGSSRLSP